MYKNLEYRARERQDKAKIGGRPAKLNQKKNKGVIFLLEEQHENFVAAVTKWEMLADTNQGENERQWKKKWTRLTYDISSKKRVTKKFLEVSHCSRAARAKLLFAN